MLDKLKAKAAEKYLFKVVEEEVALRAQPTTTSPQVGTLEYGQIVLVCDLCEDGWARLHEDQVWASGLLPEDWHPADGPLRVFVLVNGKQIGLPQYLRRENLPLDEWEYSEAVRCVEASGVTWRRPPGGLLPKSLLDLAWLSPWHSPDGTLMEAPSLLHDPMRYLDWPLPRLCVVSMVRGAKPAALESFILYYHSIGFEQVKLYFDKPDDPGEAEAIAIVEQFGKPCPTGPDGMLCTAMAMRCTAAWWEDVRRNSRYYQRQQEPLDLYKETVRLDSEVRDVQARQMLAIDHALFEAQADRFHWVLHVDVDELLFFPDEDRHRDARKFFYEVPHHFTSIRFANLEAVPEAMEMDDPFQEISLFKMNPMLLQELGVEPRILADGDVAPEDEERPEDLFDSHNADAVPGGQSNSWTRLPRKERHALRRLLAVMHDIATKRSDILEKLKVKLNPIPQPQTEDDDSDWSDDESCFGPRPHCPAYFNSYSNGKCAVRTEVGPRGEYPPLPAGVHGFLRDGGAILFTLLCKGPGAPVVLHYSNCGYSQWKKKYQIICKGHGTNDGAFSTTREGIAEVRSHLATRQLILRENEDDLQCFYRTFVQGNERDEVAYLAQFGLVLRLKAQMERLQTARKRFEERRRESAAQADAGQ